MASQPPAPGEPGCSSGAQIPGARASDFEGRNSGCSQDSTSCRSEDSMDGRVTRLKRWDGAARTCADWDSLRRDPELWYDGGNCLVHLHGKGKGQSRRGPSFLVPFQALVDAKCQPLIEKCVTRDDASGQAAARCQPVVAEVELYVPAPPLSTKEQALQHHLATRNFFAWVMRKPVVGEHLGTALVGLSSTLRGACSVEGDSVGGLMRYLDEQRYLDIQNHPDHALAVLHLAESLQLKDLYIKAFAHCVGMSDRLFLSSEYQTTSAASKKLIRRARIDMDLRLGRAGAMLQTFLEDELDESRLGLAAGARAHLARFRAHLQRFYAARLGQYPPPSTDRRVTMFGPEVSRAMRRDFEALYQYLVDDEFTTADSSPPLAQGGLCTLQSVHSFDLRHRFPSLDHPLPLLPEQAPGLASASASAPAPARRGSSRRISWLGGGGGSRGDKLHPDRRLVAHTALLKATNKARTELLANGLVQAYRAFEEDLALAPAAGKAGKAGRAEKVGPADGRKVRWILVYAVHQTLRNCTAPPRGVAPRPADEDVPYHLAVSTESLPPWEHDEGSKSQEARREQLGQAIRAAASPTPWAPAAAAGAGAAPAPRGQQRAPEIKPDVDYLALAHQERRRARDPAPGTPSAAPRSRSLSRGIDSTIRRSLTRLTGLPSSGASSSASSTRSRRESMPAQPHQRHRPRRPSYHEIVVHGYGNGTNDVQLCTDSPAPGEQQQQQQQQQHPAGSAAATRSASTASSASGGSSAVSSWVGPESPRTEYTVSSWAGSRRGSLADKEHGVAFEALSPEILEEPAPTDGAHPAAPAPPALPRRSSKRFSAVIPPAAAAAAAADFGPGAPEPPVTDLHPSPLRIRKGGATFAFPAPPRMAPLPSNPDEWTEVQGVLDAGCDWLSRRPKPAPRTWCWGEGDDEFVPEWEQFTDLGGLCPVVSMGP